MKEHVVYLDLKDGEKILDLYAETEWDFIALTSKDRAVTAEHTVKLELDDQPRLIRSIDENTFLIAEPRTDGPDNLHIYERTGTHIRSFLAGDGIADILVHHGKIIVTYFDEGVVSGIGPAINGLTVFDIEGTELFGLNTAETGDYMLDCYCACKAGPDRVIFYAYPDRKLFELSLDTLKVKPIETPTDIFGVTAISPLRSKIIFYCHHADHLGFYTWSKTKKELTGIGSYPSPLKGLPNGKFLTFGDMGYTIVDVSEHL